MDRPSVNAHLAHGDTMGACGSVTTSTTSTIKVPPGQAKKELDSAGAKFVPPGQAKRELNTASGGFIPPGQVKKQTNSKTNKK